jgi:hypothetical protein
MTFQSDLFLSANHKGIWLAKDKTPKVIMSDDPLNYVAGEKEQGCLLSFDRSYLKVRGNESSATLSEVKLIRTREKQTDNDNYVVEMSFFPIKARNTTVSNAEINMKLYCNVTVDQLRNRVKLRDILNQKQFKVELPQYLEI